MQEVCYWCMNVTNGSERCPHCKNLPSKVRWTPPCLKPGTLLNGKYLLGRTLGQGGFGITYIGLHRLLGKRVAIKEFFPDRAAGGREGNTVMRRSGEESRQFFEVGLEQFRQEGRRIVQFSHPNIVRAIDFFEENDTAYLVMDYVDGVSLEQYLRQQGGRLSEEQTLRILIPVMEGLRAVHEAGLLHRDIKPGNIYLTKSGQVILLDFGSAREAYSAATKSLDVMLTPGYAPPEQYSRRGKQGPWSDIYSCAATIYRCLTGNRPADALERMSADDPAELIPPSNIPGVDVSPHVEDTLMMALALSYQHRPQRMIDFQRAIMGYTVTGMETDLEPSLLQDSPPPHAVPSFVRESRRGGMKALICAILLLLILGAAAYGSYTLYTRIQAAKFEDRLAETEKAANDVTGEERELAGETWKQAEQTLADAKSAPDRSTQMAKLSVALDLFHLCKATAQERKTARHAEEQKTLDDARTRAETAQKTLRIDEGLFKDNELRHARELMEKATRERDTAKAIESFNQAEKAYVELQGMVTARKQTRQDQLDTLKKNVEEARARATEARGRIGETERNFAADKVTEAEKTFTSAQNEKDPSKAAEGFASATAQFEESINLAAAKKAEEETQKRAAEEKARQTAAMEQAQTDTDREKAKIGESEHKYAADALQRAEAAYAEAEKETDPLKAAEGFTSARHLYAEAIKTAADKENEIKAQQNKLDQLQAELKKARATADEARAQISERERTYAAESVQHAESIYANALQEPDPEKASDGFLNAAQIFEEALSLAASKANQPAVQEDAARAAAALEQQRSLATDARARIGETERQYAAMETQTADEAFADAGTKQNALEAADAYAHAVELYEAAIQAAAFRKAKFEQDQALGLPNRVGDSEILPPRTQVPRTAIPEQ